MCQPLPTDGFEWMTDEELTNWRDIPCILEVDLEYPDKLHNDLPLALEHVMVGKVEKLKNDKTKYVIHRRALKQYISMGLKVTKIHRGVKFEESPWLAEYIEKNTDLQKKTTTKSGKNFFKLMNNVVYGKTMEKKRDHVNIKLVTNENSLTKLVKKSQFEQVSIFSENLVAVHSKKTVVKMDKPIYVGASILDISKTRMYNFHYNYIKKKYGDKASLLFTDTDSLCYEIKTDDFYQDISDDVDKWFDTSEYDKDHPSGIPTGKNEKVIGMMKDECKGTD